MTHLPNTAVILAGGKGTRMTEYTKRIPKPMVEVCETPMLIHIMRTFYAQGVKNFIICTGYKSDVIEDYFDHYIEKGKITQYLPDGTKRVIKEGEHREGWTVTIVNSGTMAHTATADRIKSVENVIEEQEFFMTYGDCLGDVNLHELYHTHEKNGHLVTLTAVSLEERYGVIRRGDNGTIESFAEKDSHTEEKLINGGFMVIKKDMLKGLPEQNAGDFSKVLEKMTKSGDVGYYSHPGFWIAVDSLRDLEKAQKYIEENPDVLY